MVARKRSQKMICGLRATPRESQKDTTNLNFLHLIGLLVAIMAKGILYHALPMQQ